MALSYEEFDKTSLADWKAQALVDGKGKIDPEQLQYVVEPGLSVSSFQNHETTTHLVVPQLAKTTAGIVASSKQKDVVMKALANGAQSLLLHWQDDTAIAPFFDGIFVELLDVYIDDSGCEAETKQALRHFMDHQVYDVTFYDDRMVLLSASSSFQERIASYKARLHSSLVMVELKSDFLAQIAELRAIRYLGRDTDLKIIAILPPELSSTIERQSLIGINYQIMSAYIGGADTVFINSEDPAISRLALNVQHIIQLETSIGHVVDPMAGSYIIEALTKAMIEV
jgi:hypothetical protein